MRTVFADSNIFLRLFTQDDVEQQERAEDLLRKAAKGKICLLTGPPVLFEIAWRLKTAYRQPREKILEMLNAIAAFPGLKLIDGDLVEEAIALARASGQEFADAYLATIARKNDADAIATFNRKHFEKMDVNLYPL